MNGTISTENAVLIDADQLGEILGVSRTTVWRMASEGRTPCAIRLRKSVRWSRLEIDRWIAAGCPDRRTWQRIKASKN